MNKQKQFFRNKRSVVYQLFPCFFDKYLKQDIHKLFKNRNSCPSYKQIVETSLLKKLFSSQAALVSQEKYCWKKFLEL
ncbi:hypothetical protein pb186bvf_009961 [Paramecium bursaria]